MPGILSPDPHNYVVGKGFLLFQPSYAVLPFHIGNVPKYNYTPKVDTLPHFSEMQGTSVQDFSIILRKGGEVSIDMEEMTANNMSLFFLADINASHPDAVELTIYAKLSQIEGQLWFYATNDVGPRWYQYLSRVLLNPTGTFDPISDKYNVMTVNGAHVIDSSGLFGTLTLMPPVSTIVPENVLAPFITGLVNQGDDPTYAQVGQILYANLGAWIGISTRVNYQWNKGGVAIVGAITSTYTPITGDIGAVLTVDVTGVNPNGSTTVTSSATAAVVA